MADVTANSGANGIMLDTSILSKVSNICLVDTDPDRQNARGETMVDINRLVSADSMQLRGILPLDDIEFFVNYCHHRGIFANVGAQSRAFKPSNSGYWFPNSIRRQTSRECVGR